MNPIIDPIVKEIVADVVAGKGKYRHLAGADNKIPRNRARYYVNLFAEVADSRIDKLTARDILVGALLIEKLASSGDVGGQA